MMKVEVHLYSQSEPCRYDTVINAYTKDGLYCILKANGDVHKHPVQHIFRVKESTPAESRVLLYAPAGEPQDFWEAAAKYLVKDKPLDIEAMKTKLTQMWAEWY